jgi:hypothetical protein
LEFATVALIAVPSAESGDYKSLGLTGLATAGGAAKARISAGSSAPSAIVPVIQVLYSRLQMEDRMQTLAIFTGIQEAR